MGELNPERRRTRAAAKADNPRQRRLVRIGTRSATVLVEVAECADPPPSRAFVPVPLTVWKSVGG
jgi:hypothetical protein